MKTLNLLKLRQGQQDREEDDRETRKKQVWENRGEQQGQGQPRTLHPQPGPHPPTRSLRPFAPYPAPPASTTQHGGGGGERREQETEQVTSHRGA